MYFIVHQVIGASAASEGNMAASAATCTCEACSKARTRIQRIFSVLDVYGWLLDSYVVDFYQENLWEKLPSSWRIVLQSVSPEELGKWLTNDILCTQVWPLSLLALRQLTNDLQINRDYQNDENVLRCGKANKFRSKYDAENLQNKSEKMHAAFSKCNNLFLKHVKIKKRHELQQMARICADCAYESDTKCIVDAGAGMGHLARSLAFKYNLHIVCLEQNELLSQQARKWDKELLESISKHLPDIPANLPQHVSIRLDCINSDKADLITNIQKLLFNNFELNKMKTKFGIVGLHPCGDLAATLLKLYTMQCEIRFLCIVGCCYMKLTVECPTNAINGYPLSKYLLSLTNHKLSYNALEVACHAIENYCDKLKTGHYEDLIVHAYRAVLETVLVKRDKQLRHIQVKNVKVTKAMTFKQYCIAAIANFESHLRPENSDFQNPQIESFLKQWQQIVIFGALRTMLAPLVETVVLLDRFLFLSENNLSPVLKPIFDARLSPRNFVLFSIKNTE